MRIKKLLAAFLLGVGLCFVCAPGYGRIRQISPPSFKPEWMSFYFLEAQVKYIMTNPTRFLNIAFSYDLGGRLKPYTGLPETIDTEDKIFIEIWDNRGIFSDKSGIALLDQFKRELEVVYTYISLVATEMNTDIVAKFLSRESIPLGYFYQGEYHLWEK